MGDSTCLVSAAVTATGAGTAGTGAGAWFDTGGAASWAGAAGGSVTDGWNPSGPRLMRIFNPSCSMENSDRSLSFIMAIIALICSSSIGSVLFKVKRGVVPSTRHQSVKPAPSYKAWFAFAKVHRLIGGSCFLGG